MKIGAILTLVFGAFIVVLIASTGAFGEIISSFTSTMGPYGFLIGVCIVLMIILGLLGIGGRR